VKSGGEKDLKRANENTQYKSLIKNIFAVFHHEIYGAGEAQEDFFYASAICLFQLRTDTIHLKKEIVDEN
jgi:hypothetical protein